MQLPDFRGIPRALQRCSPTGTLGRCFRRAEVETQRCVHLSGQRYDGDPPPAPVRYLRALLDGEPVLQVRRVLIDHLRCYRPGDLAEALGLDALEGTHRDWIYPWERPRPRHSVVKKMWHERTDQLPGVLYHFSADGIPTELLDAEFTLFEAALESLRSEGYRPTRHRDPVRVQALVEGGRALRFIVLDGHHRVTAMAALGRSSFDAICRPADDVILEQLPRWYGVRRGAFSSADAQKIFAGYARGPLRAAPASEPASLLASNSWLARYDLDTRDPA